VLLLVNTTDKISLISSAAATLDVHASIADNATGTITYDKQNTAITTATTTDIVAAPASGKVRNVRSLNIRNKHASLSCNVTVQYNQNGTLFELHATTLKPGELLSYVEGIGFFLYTTGALLTTTYSTADQAIAAATTAYLTGSALVIPASRPIGVGTIFRWTVVQSKTAAGTGTGIWEVRFGTGGSTSDTVRVTFTGAVQTAAADQARIDIDVIVRGPIGASCIVNGSFSLAHNAAAAAGFLSPTLDVNSSAFDITTAGMIVGLSHQSGTGNVITVQQVTGQILNI
jgi:hypothetical protein